MVCISIIIAGGQFLIDVANSVTYEQRDKASTIMVVDKQCESSN